MPTAIAATMRPGVVEGLHDAGKALVHVDLRAAQQVVLRDAGVVEADHGGVGRLDAELVLEALDGHARVLARHDERLDRRAAHATCPASPTPRCGWRANRR